MRKSRDGGRIAGPNGQEIDWKTVPMQRAIAVEESNLVIKRGCWDACGFRPVERVGYIQSIGMTMAGDGNTAMCDQRALSWSLFAIKTLRTHRAYNAFFQRREMVEEMPVQACGPRSWQERHLRALGVLARKTLSAPSLSKIMTKNRALFRAKKESPRPTS